MRGFARGLAASLSIAAGYFPVALSFGVAAIEAGLSPALVMLISVAVYAGASQFLMASLLASGAGFAAAVPTVLLMNARHVFYGPAVARQLAPLPSPVASPLLAFGLTDEVFATAMARIDRTPQECRAGWLFGLSCGAYAAWLAGTACGVLVVGDADSWPSWLREAMQFVLPALFFALLLEAGLRRWSAALVGAAVGTLATLPWLAAHHALLAGIVAGAAAHAAWHLPRRAGDAP